MSFLSSARSQSSNIPIRHVILSTTSFSTTSNWSSTGSSSSSSKIPAARDWGSFETMSLPIGDKDKSGPSRSNNNRGIRHRIQNEDNNSNNNNNNRSNERRVRTFGRNPARQRSGGNDGLKKDKDDTSALLKWGVSAQSSTQNGVIDSLNVEDRGKGKGRTGSGFGLRKTDYNTNQEGSNFKPRIRNDNTATTKSSTEVADVDSSSTFGSSQGALATDRLDQDDMERGNRDRRGRRVESDRSFRSLRGTDGEVALPSRDRSRLAKDQGRTKGGKSTRPEQKIDRVGMNLKRGNQKQKELEKKTEKEVFIPSAVSVGRLADIFGVKLFYLQSKMMRMGLEEEMRRSDYLLSSEQACDIAIEYGFDPVVDDEKSFDIVPQADTNDGTLHPLRPPVVTIMGHVDHGKTTLLDALRHTSVAAHEAGGITQHIGAFSVPIETLIPNSTASSSSAPTITFLDTPGHAAFTGMRARGASVTDLVVLVVAADDGVMPQTKEVIELVKSEGDGVGLVVAINKCDKPTVDFAKVKSALGAEGILLEEDGGDTPGVRVSGLAKTGLDDLVETLSTLAEIRDLRARRDGQAEGFILESRVDKGRGNIATVLVTRGTLHAGSIIVAGQTWAKVRQMQDDKGRAVKLALPGTPVSITGWKDLPSAGDQLLEAKDEDQAKKAITNRLREIERKKLLEDVEQINVKRREERLKVEREAAEEAAILAAGGTLQQAHMMERLHDQEEKDKDGFRELRLVIKGDVSGTVEAVVGSLSHIGNKEAGVKIIHTGVGDVSESDVALADAAGATIIGFSVSCPRSIQNQANTASVPLHLESVIYRLIDTVRQKVASLLPPTIEIRVTGEAIVQQLFPIKVKRDITMVGGCKVSNGTISKHEKVRVLRSKQMDDKDNDQSGVSKNEKEREREVVFEGFIDTLKHLKKDVGEVRKGTECGISFTGFNDLKEGDEVVTFTTVEVPREL